MLIALKVTLSSVYTLVLLGLKMGVVWGWRHSKKCKQTLHYVCVCLAYTIAGFVHVVFHHLPLDFLCTKIAWLLVIVRKL